MDTTVTTWMQRISSAAECSNPHCRQSYRLRFWKKLKGAWMQGAWFCSHHCLEHVIEHNVEEILFKKPFLTRAAHRMPLGLLMLSRGSLNNEQLRTALLTQRSEPSGRIGQWLQRLGYATERQVVSALALQWGTPVLAFPEELAPQSTIPSGLLSALRIVPVRLAPKHGILYIAFSDPVDYAVLRAIEQMTGWTTSPCIVSDRVMDRLLSRLRSSETDSTHTFENVVEPAEIARITASYGERLRASEVKLAECGSYIWARLKSGSKDSDILFHLSRQSRIQPGSWNTVGPFRLFSR